MPLHVCVTVGVQLAVTLDVTVGEPVPTNVVVARGVFVGVDDTVSVGKGIVGNGFGVGL